MNKTELTVAFNDILSRATVDELEALGRILKGGRPLRLRSPKGVPTTFIEIPIMLFDDVKKELTEKHSELKWERTLFDDVENMIDQRIMGAVNRLMSDKG